MRWELARLSLSGHTFDTDSTLTSYSLNKFDAARASKEGCQWKSLVDKTQRARPLYVPFRRKCLAFTVGPHILIVHFGREGNMCIILVADFQEHMSAWVESERWKGSRGQFYDVEQPAQSGEGAGEATDEEGEEEDKENPTSEVVVVVNRNGLSKRTARGMVNEPLESGEISGGISDSILRGPEWGGGQ
ncbi:hypothetical protein DFH09DRAFT_1078487 [Mycena vulgaris]|nr:hypothetical protein DFH09DRAFT_1078487 [Mycena vulgaris]